MKKIIYSLVIMIAAGSLFTSCIEPVEPVGIFDLREAKARYYDALSKLRAADAEKVLAEADLVKAQAEMKRAKVEYQNLLNEEQRLFNEATALGNEKEAAKWAMEIEELKKDHELKMIQYEQQIAEAQEALRQALSKIQMAALDLTDAEKEALTKAIGRYEEALAKFQAAQEKVLQAEANLWEAEYAINNVTDDFGIYAMTIYGTLCYTGEDLETYYNSAADYCYAQAAYYLQVIQDLEGQDVTKWAEELVSLNEELDQVKYNRYQVTKDSVLYMNTVFCDGNTEFELAVKAWMEEHPAVADPGKKPAAPKESDYPVSDTSLIKFPVLEYTQPNQAFDKFRSLLSSYEAVTSIGGDTTKNVIVVDATKKTITLNASQEMKDFVMGTATSSKNSQVLAYYDKVSETDVEVTADYGLNGALSVLKREGVLKGKENKTPEELAEDLKKAKELWEADRDTLLKFYQAIANKDKDPYLAYEPIKKAKEALADAVSSDSKANTGLANAAQALIDKLNGITPHADYSQPDTLTLVEAIVAFATARQQYLPYTAYKNSGIDSNLFYYAYAESPVLIDSSLNFKDLTYKMMLEKPWFSHEWTNRPTKPETQTNLNGTDKEGAFANIFNQLLGPAVGAKILTPAAVVADDLNNGNAFYGTYEFVPAAGDDPAYMKDKVTGEKVEDPAVQKAKDALAVAVSAFNECFKRYWNVDPAADGNDYANFKKGGAYEKYNPAAYEIKTFTEPYNVVVFDEDGETILPTAAMQVILASVDPNKVDGNNQGTNFDVIATTSAIFNANNTDFYKYMKAAWAADNTDTTAAIAKIEQWIADVQAAFEKDATDAADAAKKAYEKAVKNYDKAVEKWEKSKAEYDAYLKALEAFVGTDEDGELINVKKESGKLVPAITKIAEPVDYETAAVKQELVAAQTYTGEWIFGGEQAELAEKCFPEFPELLAEWHSTAEQTDHQIMHLEAIIDTLEKAYLAAIAVAEGDADIPTDFDTVEEYFEYLLVDLVEWYESWISNGQTMEYLAERASMGYDPAQIALEGLKHKLELAQQELKDAEIELEAAKVYYDKVLAATVGKN